MGGGGWIGLWTRVTDPNDSVIPVTTTYSYNRFTPQLLQSYESVRRVSLLQCNRRTPKGCVHFVDLFTFGLSMMALFSFLVNLQGTERLWHLAKFTKVKKKKKSGSMKLQSILRLK